MAADKEIAVKVSIDPFQEVDKKKWKQMEADVKGFKKPGRVDYSARFTVTSARWNKRTLEEGVRAVFRYDLSLFAAQVWQDFAPIAKARNGQDKSRLEKAFLKAVPRLQKAMAKKLSQKLAEFQEDVASGAADDLGEIKGTRKGLNPARARQIGVVAKRLAEKFESEFNRLKALKDAQTRASGEDKAKAGQELEKALGPGISLLAKQLEGVLKGINKLLTPIKASPARMAKSVRKDMSDAAKAEYKKSAKELEKALKPLEAAIAAGKKNTIEALTRMKRKDFSSAVKALGLSALNKIDDSAGKLSDTVKAIDSKLKKLEQAAKKRK